MKHFEKKDEIQEIFRISDYGLALFVDEYATIFFSCNGRQALPISKMPWKLQLPFFLTFLHDHSLAERFKDMEIVGAIDLYIKWKFCSGEELILSN